MLCGTVMRCSACWWCSVHCLPSSSAWFRLFKVEMAGSRLGWCFSLFILLDFCVSRRDGFFCNWFLSDGSVASFSQFPFLLGIILDSFRVEGRFEILRSPVGWFGALPFCFFGLAGPNQLANWACENSLSCVQPVFDKRGHLVSNCDWFMTATHDLWQEVTYVFFFFGGE